MSEGLNKVMLLGHLGADPELRVTPGGQAVLKLRIATNESYLDRNNARQERTEWHRVTIWGKRAEALVKFLKKGDSLFVEGRLQTSSYEKNGEKRYSTDIVATNVILAGGKRGEGSPQRSHNAASSHNAGAPEETVEPSGGAGGGIGDDDIPFATCAVVPHRTDRLPRWERP